MPTYSIKAPDGRTYRITGPVGATQEQIQAEVLRQHPNASGRGGPDNRPKSFWEGVKEGFHPVAQNFDRIASNINPLMLAADALGLVDTAGTRKKVDARFQQNQASASSRGSTLGKIAGGVVGTLPTLIVPGGPVLQGALGGALMNEDGTLKGVARDAVIGGVGGKAGGMFGKRVVAPVAERVGRTAPARAVSKAVVNATNKLLPGNVSQLPLPRFTPTDKAVNRMAPDVAAARQVAADAARLKLPVALADVDPRLQQLAGSVARHAPDARALAEKALNPRALGQADRAVNAIDTHLAPITNIEQRAADIRKAAQAASEPFYTQARAMPAPVDEQLTTMLRTPAGRSALNKAYTIAQNEGRDPNAMGMFTDDTGTVWIGETPKFETLQMVKRGLDAELAPYRNPVTNKLDLEGRPEAAAINDLLGKFNTRLKDLNEPYRLGNEAYAGQIARRDALAIGRDMAANNVPQRQFDAALGRMDDVTRPEMGRGFATSMADTVNKARLSANPYNSVYGSPNQQAKIGALFPEGASDFGRLADIEGIMAQTRTKALGGSQTQANKAADDLFQNDAANMAVDGALQAVTGGGVPGATKLAGMFGRKVLGSRDLGVLGAEKKANAIAPMLFDTSNPAAIIDFLDELARKRLEQEVRRNAYQNVSSTLGRSLGAVPAVAIGGSLAQ